MALKTYGLMQVDWEERVNFPRLRQERLARAKKLLKESELGALLCFDMNNIRYITSTHIGTWAVDKLVRFCLLPQNDEPDHVGLRFGGAAPPDVLSVAGGRAVAGGDLAVAGGDVTRVRPGGGRGAEDPGGARGARLAA